MAKNNKKTARWLIACVSAVLCFTMSAACTGESADSGTPASREAFASRSDAVEPAALLARDQKPTEGVYLWVMLTINGGGAGYYIPDEATQTRLLELIDGFTIAGYDSQKIMQHTYSGVVVHHGDAEYYIHSDGFVAMHSHNGGKNTSGYAQGQTEFCDLALAVARDEIGLEPFFDPATITGVVSATLDYTYQDFANAVVVDGEYKELPVISGTQTITDPQALAGLSGLLQSAEDVGMDGVGCGFGNLLTLIKDDGTAVGIMLASDGCDTFIVDGRFFCCQSEHEPSARAYDWFDQIPKGAFSR